LREAVQTGTTAAPAALRAAELPESPAPAPLEDALSKIADVEHATLQLSTQLADRPVR